MKTKILLFATLLSITFFIGCNTNEPVNQTTDAITTDAAITNSDIDASIDDVSIIAEDQFDMQKSMTVKTSMGMVSMLPPCATVNTVLTDNTWTRTIDFGTQGCALHNGNVLKGKIDAMIDANPGLRKYRKQMLLDITSEGLRIQIVDEQNRPMFAMAKADLQPYTREILHAIGIVLNDVPNKIGLSGHTDATPYSSDVGYSNWELSADRANASRRELIAGGMDETKLLRVVGLSSASMFDKKNPFNPTNRRISIIIMNKQAEENVLKDDEAVNVSADSTEAELGKAVVKP